MASTACSYISYLWMLMFNLISKFFKLMGIPLDLNFAFFFFSCFNLHVKSPCTKMLYSRFLPCFELLLTAFNLERLSLSLLRLTSFGSVVSLANRAFHFSWRSPQAAKALKHTSFSFMLQSNVAVPLRQMEAGMCVWLFLSTITKFIIIQNKLGHQWMSNW